jgi:hypothetical protein
MIDRVLTFRAATGTPEIDYPKPERLVRGNPRRATVNLYTDPAGELSCGIWSCETGAWKIDFPRGKDEYFHVLEGRIRITGETGLAEEFGPGDAGVIRAGFKGLFEVLEAVRKHYVVSDRSGS